MTGRMSGSRRTRKRFPGPDAAGLVVRSAKVWWAGRVAALYGPFRRLRTSSYDVRAGGESVLVMSAGIRATAGEPMQPRAIDELTRRGISSDGFRSTPLDLGVVGHAHLVLTATRSQRDQLVASVPGALKKTFTWRELAWLLSDSTSSPSFVSRAGTVHKSV
jgi:protein-tyrosine-phosphatase